MDTPLLGFSHVQLRVRDVAASSEWYATVLGVEPYLTADDGTYVALKHRPSHVIIVISSRARRRRRGRPDVPLDHLAFAVPDGDTAATVGRPPHRRGHRPSRRDARAGKPSLQLVDPDGISIELVAPAPRPGVSRRRSAG